MITLSVQKPSPERLKRQAIGATIWDLSLASGIHAGTLSQVERGLARLSPEQEARRRKALRELKNGVRVAIGKSAYRGAADRG